ncbi:hypothetical protein Cgig2_021023 [Carnegiea gigantea]|uniref:Uncharacterized protein n=1 Tax=Carnegiea gigantea TaxID=171969 RepID=A0A9Q1JLJ5_9CARY|nr:hypothetical protein Cgig2_021023 [Carnegiea gigantea]
MASRLPQPPTRNLPTHKGWVRVPCEHPLNCCLMPLRLLLLWSLVVYHPYYDFFVYLADHLKVLFLDPFESVYLEVEGLAGNIDQEMLRGESTEGSITKITNLIDAVEILLFCTASNLPNFQLNKKPHHEVWKENMVDLEKQFIYKKEKKAYVININVLSLFKLERKLHTPNCLFLTSSFKKI